MCMLHMYMYHVLYQVLYVFVFLSLHVIDTLL